MKKDKFDSIDLKLIIKLSIVTMISKAVDDAFDEWEKEQEKSK